jgi:holo-[acyl-carrier protein] synthase
MAIIGIGTDLVAIDRIKQSWQQFGERFAHRILSETELTSDGFRSQPVAFLAKRFAAKEAIMKALGTGLAQGIRFDDFSVVNDEQGKPVVLVQGEARERMSRMGIRHFHISISDEKKYALAFVVAEG